MNGKIIAIVGPTASGKTALGIRLAKRLNGEIVCADSRTVYKGMDIISAKPTEEERRLVRHHLLDVADPNQDFSVAKFKELATLAIQDIQARAKTPIIVGGSGLYIDSLLYNFSFKGATGPEREYLNLLSVEELQELCSQKNIELPNNRMNKRHLIRAIETGGRKPTRSQLPSNTVVAGILVDRKDLKTRVTKRIHSMINNGALEEVAQLKSRFGEKINTKATLMQPAQRYLDGEISLEEMIDEAVRRDMALAKRQMTWFKRNTDTIWGRVDELEKMITDRLSD